MILVPRREIIVPKRLQGGFLLSPFRFGGGSIDPIAVSLWAKLTDYWNLDESSGSYANGISARHLTRNGTVATRTGPAGGADVAPDFTPGGGYAWTADAADLRWGNRDFALWAWLLCDGAATTRIPISKWNAQSGNREHSIYVYSGGVGIQYYNLSGVYKSLDFSASLVPSWTFVYIEQNRTSGLLQGRINGSPTGVSTTDAVISSNSDFLVSGLIGSGGSVDFKHDGGVSRVGMAAGTVLTDDEQAYLYNGGAGKTWQQIKADAGVP